MDMAYFIALLFAKNVAFLPLGEPKIGTENDLASLSFQTILNFHKNGIKWTSVSCADPERVAQNTRHT